MTSNNTPLDLDAERLSEITEAHPGDWYAGEWRSQYVDSTADELAHYVVKHQESGTVLAELPDWAGPIALFVADAHDAVPALLAEVRRLRAAMTELEEDSARLNALYAGGVDNWEGYDDALELL